MKSKSGLIGLTIVVVCVWQVVTATQAAQLKKGVEQVKKPVTMDGCECECDPSPTPTPNPE